MPSTAISPFGGLANSNSFLGQLGFARPPPGTLAFLRAGKWLRTLRAGNAFCDGSFLDFPKERALPHAVVARIMKTLSNCCAGLKACFL